MRVGTAVTRRVGSTITARRGSVARMLATAAGGVRGILVQRLEQRARLLHDVELGLVGAEPLDHRRELEQRVVADARAPRHGPPCRGRGR